MDDLLSAFAGPAQIADSTPNPEIDDALGFGASPNDSWAQSFAKGLSSSMYRNSEEGRKLTADFAKQKLANKLALDLEERKQQLAQKYQNYQFHQMPWGSIVSMGEKTGEVKDTGVGGDINDPNSMAGKYRAKFDAETAAATEKAKLEADPEYIAAEKENALAKPALTKANTEYLKNVKPQLAQSLMNADNARADATRHPPVKAHVLTPSDEAVLEKSAQAEALGDSVSNPMLWMNWNSAVKKDPSIVTKKQEIFNRKKKEYEDKLDAQEQGGSGMAAPRGAAQAPDLTGAFSPIQVD